MSQHYFRFGDIVHYRWGGEDPKPHTASMVVGRRRRDDMLMLLWLEDTLVSPPAEGQIDFKAPDMYEPCTATCPFNPDHEGASS